MSVITARAGGVEHGSDGAGSGDGVSRVALPVLVLGVGIGVEPVSPAGAERRPWRRWHGSDRGQGN